MKKINISDNVLIVDADKFNSIKDFKISINKRRESSTYYASIRVSGKKVLLHRYLLNVKDGQFVDHINGNGLDNRISNLRICSLSENQMNRKKQSNNTSGYKGVTWNKGKSKWAVRIQFNKKSKHIGYFDCVKEAAKAYNSAAIKYHKDFAILNKL